MKVKVLFGTVNLEQSKETLRAELGRSKMQSKMVYGGKEQSLSRAQDHFFNTSTEASVAVSLVEGGQVQKSERPHKFCRGQDFRKRKLFE